MFMGEKFGRDSIWEVHLAQELWKTGVQIEAVLDQVTVPLGDVLSLEVGSRIMLNATPESNIELRCGEIPLFSGTMGRKGRNISVRVEDKAHSRKVPQ